MAATVVTPQRTPNATSDTHAAIALDVTAVSNAACVFGMDSRTANVSTSFRRRSPNGRVRRA